MQRVKLGALCYSLLLPAALAVTASPGRAQDIAARGRELVATRSDAVVTVKLAMKVRMSMEGREQEQESTSEVTATVIDPSGLAVCALSEADPTSAIGHMMGEDSETRFQIDVTDTKVRLGDGTELPAKIVLRDKDLDLAFIRVTQPPAKPLTAVDPAAAAPSDVMEEVFILNRMGEVGNRAPVVVMDRIVGVIKKPRTMYVPGPVGQYTNLGCPVFTTEGKFVGIIVNRFPPQGAGGGREERAPVSVIMPAADIADIAKQAAPPKPAPAAK